MSISYKDKKDLKFSLVLPGYAIPPHIVDCLNEQPARSGMYNWLFVHKGEINAWEQIKHRAHEYDILQVNMAPVDMPLVHEIRRVLDQTNCKTKLVLNNDYVCEYWSKWGLDPTRYRQIQRCGDMVFGTERHQTSHMIKGAFTIPHATNIEVLQRLGFDRSKAQDSVAYIYHWWNPETYLAHLTLEAVKRKLGVKKSRIVGYSPKNLRSAPDLMEQFTKGMFDEVTPTMRFPDYMDLAQKQRCLFDPNACHTYGRNGVEAACLGIPLVGSDRVFSNKMLFPDLVCDPYDHHATMARFKIVFDGGKRMKEIMAQAREKVEYFNYDNSRERYLEALDMAVKRGGVDWYKKQQ